MTRKISSTGLDCIKRWEGLRLQAYQDQAGVWTIGYGHTAAAGKPIPFTDMTITEKEAEALLLRDLKQYERTVSENVRVDLTDNQFAALVSFCFNIGVDSFRKSTCLKRLNAGDYNGVPTELMKWVHSGGKRIQGLVNRRAAESGLWVKGGFVSSGCVPANGRRDRAILTPGAIGPAIGAASGLAGFASSAGPVQWALAIIMVAAFAIGAWYFIRHVWREMA